MLKAASMTKVLCPHLTMVQSKPEPLRYFSACKPCPVLRHACMHHATLADDDSAKAACLAECQLEAVKQRLRDNFEIKLRLRKGNAKGGCKESKQKHMKRPEH